MFINTLPPRRNGIAYLLWRWILKNNGEFCASFDSWYFGPSRGMNDYNVLATSYRKTDAKPDKLYSILPTVLSLIGDCKNKTVVDIGCGSGFFTNALIEHGAKKVIGLDNSNTQLEIAKMNSPYSDIDYQYSDMFVDKLVRSDIMVAPFVANYARTIPILEHFFRQAHASLNENGKIVLVIDLPNGKNLQRFGAIKTMSKPFVNESGIKIKLFKDEKETCILNAIYFSPETIAFSLRKAGFKNIEWHKPLISQEGMTVLGNDFWQGYLDDPELGYVSAEK
jgi:SAM-dependent methyltransferase